MHITEHTTTKPDGRPTANNFQLFLFIATLINMDFLSRVRAPLENRSERERPLAFRVFCALLLHAYLAFKGPRGWSSWNRFNNTLDQSHPKRSGVQNAHWNLPIIESSACFVGHWIEYWKIIETNVWVLFNGYKCKISRVMIAVWSSIICSHWQNFNCSRFSKIYRLLINIRPQSTRADRWYIQVCNKFTR